MNIKQKTIDEYRKQVDTLISNKKFSEALALAAKYPLKDGHESGYVICKTRLLDQYEVNENDLEKLNQIKKDNPHYKSMAPMILFLEEEAKKIFKLKISMGKAKSKSKNVKK